MVVDFSTLCFKGDEKFTMSSLFNLAMSAAAATTSSLEVTELSLVAVRKGRQNLNLLQKRYI